MALLAAIGATVLLLAARAQAVDEEGCLLCHGLDLRAAASEPDGRELRVREAVGGSHDALFCSDCHPDARRAPHAAVPGPAQCIGECHGEAAGARESHRRASYGGLSESHRGLSTPDAPCRLCHRATDRPGSRETVLARCAGCHAGERASERRGVHARLSGRGASGLCASCHVPHPATPGAAKAACDGAGCHKGVSDAMRRLVGHKARVAGGRLSEAGVLIAFAAAGWIAGRRLSPRARRRGDAP